MSKRVNNKQRLAQKRRKSHSRRINAVSVAKQMGFLLFMLTVLFIFQPDKASAATISPAAGDFMWNDGDSICQLEEALTNINDGARTAADCIEVGTYGVDDTISLPNGTIENLGGSGYFSLYASASVVGQDQSVIKDYELNLSGSGLGTSISLQDFTIRNSRGISAYNLENLSVTGVEIDGQNDNSGSGVGIQAEAIGYLDIQDSYLHDFSQDSSYSTGIYYYSGSTPNEQFLNIENTTFNNMKRGIIIAAYAGSGGDGVVVDANIKNNTFSDTAGSEEYSGSGLSSFGLGVIAESSDDSAISAVNYTTINNTFSNRLADTYTAAILEDAWGDNQISHTAQNDLYAIGNNDGSANYRRMGNGNGDNYTITSNGGNVSDDNSFASLLTESSDKHSQTTLASFLGDLDDNGGAVPTLALLEGSPAIDAGTSVSGMTTDARGEVRPQGTAFDSGSYEYPSVGSGDPDDNGGGDSGGSSSSNQSNLNSPSDSRFAGSIFGSSNTPISITTPEGTTLTCSSAGKEDASSPDSGYTYPAGLVNFCFDSTQTNNTVTLTFVTNLKPSQVVARKYNPNTKTYANIEGATITETTYQGLHALAVTYTIVDNGPLDLDPASNKIVDPVGLALSDESYNQLANTGQSNVFAPIAAGVALLAGGIISITARFKKRTKYIFSR